MERKTQQNKQQNNEENIFQAIQQKFSIIDVARDLGITVKKIGSSFRSNSIDGDGGENALQFYDSTNTWYDHKLGKSGDVTDLVALVRFDGDKKQAIPHARMELIQNLRRLKQAQ